VGFIVTRLVGPESLRAIGLVDLVVMAVGFGASSYFARGERWRHLGFVATGTWLISGVDALRSESELTLSLWLAGAGFVAAAALVGGLVGLVVARRAHAAPPATEA
jgi:hypothetical protein